MDSICYRCLKPIVGSFEVVEGKKLGKSCYNKYIKRQRLKLAVPNTLDQHQGVPFVRTEYCTSTCFDCPFFKADICPLEENSNVSIGRRR